MAMVAAEAILPQLQEIKLLASRYFFYKDWVEFWCVLFISNSVAPTQSRLNNNHLYEYGTS